jgi:single-stranded DNA-binding protein
VIGEGDELTWVSVAVFEEKAPNARGARQGGEVYVEGRLSLNAWTGHDGEKRTGLSVGGDAVRPDRAAEAQGTVRR